MPMLKKIKYQFNDFNARFRALKQVRRKKQRIPVFFDYLLSAMRYGASASDYFEYAFYDKKSDEKKQFACYKLKKKFLHRVNDYSKAHVFNNKSEFLRTFSEFVGRDFLDTTVCSEGEYREFTKKHPKFICKPQNLSCGKGIEVLEGDVAFSELKRRGSLLEELIDQHPAMNALNPNCVNSIRISVLYTHGKMEILGAALRVGNEGCIDNYCAGGWAAKVDADTGTVLSYGCNARGERVPRHPKTGVYFPGFVIPMWDKVIALLEDAVKVVPGVSYIGWDVAIRPNDVVLIEGNFEGMFNVLQAPGNEGIKDRVTMLLKEF